jgi:SPP1 gp7 family putative phage head morphogenesis protein
MPPTKQTNKFVYSHKGAEQRYESDLKQISNEVDRIVKKFPFRVGQEINLDDAEQLIEKLQTYSEKIYDWATNTANKMLVQVDKQTKKEWEVHSQRMSLALKNELLKTNAAQRVHDIVYKNIYTGKRRAETIAKEIYRTGQVTQSRAKLIARTEVSRVSTGLTKVRSEAIDISWFRWNSVHDIRTRSAHAKMNNILCRWDEPPNPEKLFPDKKQKPYGNYLPGATFNCRCQGNPFLRISDIQWPASVHYKGKIVKMNKEQFLNIKGNENYRTGV